MSEDAERRAEAEDGGVDGEGERTGEETITRRETIVAATAGVVGTATLGLSYLFSDGDDDVDSEAPTPISPTPTETDEQVPEGEDIRDYGAAIDGQTNDAPAIMRAVRAASPGGVVYLPPGNILLDARDTDSKAIRLNASNRNVTLRGAGPESGETRLVLAPGHEGVHSAVYIGTDPGNSVGTVRLERLTIVGNKRNQGVNPGLGVRTEAEGTLIMRDCHVTSWLNAGVKLSGGMDADIQYCEFSDNGMRSNGGHDISPNQVRRQSETVIRRCHCHNSGGASVDVGQTADTELQTVLIDECILENSLASLKLSTQNKLTTVRRTQMLGGDATTIPVKVNPTDISIDDLVLEDVLIDGGGWPGIDLPCPGRLRLDNVAIMNVDQNNRQRGQDRGGIFTRDIDFRDSGRISIHNVGRNNESIALNIEDGAGSIAELVYGNVSGVGKSQGVDVKQTTRGEPLEPNVVARENVGPRSAS
ncbi:right-handed parallel beta-helix repeat-containing protein [Halogeometricum luteum]|uniref:Right-handed parallel beta-helix repeat-containing protein n=1 Tax=Halogeometricum luteum TaxID=2950537 RepID=A0ABU2G0H8_9EURY|nr:glycosyl hydrolase family 28-related protein [Halogeometricum sp. S3BR5-2]MDS0294290.1 right-handed parallel beta-helix repeat-containing protein [Halogeometricum sp. S3BR5-2]